MGAPKAMAMKAAAMTKGALADALTTEDVKKKHIVKALATLAEIGTAEVKKNGIFVIPGLCRIKTRVKPATKAGKREIWQDANRESKAGKDCRQSIRSRGLEGCRLRHAQVAFELRRHCSTAFTAAL